MSDEVVLLTRLGEILNKGQVKYFVTGSVAAMYYGEARMTRDVDVVVHLRYADVAMLAEEMTELLDRTAAALRWHASQVTVVGSDVIHSGGQREPIVTRFGLRTPR